MPFVDLKKGHHVSPSMRSSRPEVVIHGKSHTIKLNYAAYELLGRPKRVTLAWDMEEKLLGIKPAESANSGSFAVTITKYNTFVISSATVVRTIGIGLESTPFLLAEMKGEYLAVSPFKKPEGIFAEVFPEEEASA